MVSLKSLVSRVRRHAGFTVHELVVTVAIGGVLAATAVPGYRAIVINSDVNAATNTLVTSLNYARSEAIKLGAPVSVCPSNDLASCTTSPWQNGWLVFSDEPVPGVIDDTDKIIRFIKALNLNVSIDNVSIEGANFVRFQPNGGIADSCANCPAVDAIASTAHDPHLLIELISRLSPISTARAADDDSDDCSSDDDSGGGCNEPEDNAEPVDVTPGTVAFSVCSTVRGATNGRSVRISRTGQVTVARIACE